MQIMNISEWVSSLIESAFRNVFGDKYLRRSNVKDAQSLSSIHKYL